MSNELLLDVQDLHAGIENQVILHGLNLQIKPGEVHVIMGPNGSGKSTLAQLLARHPDYSLVQGSVKFCGQNLMALNPEQAAAAGIFLGLQYPTAIPGISNVQFLKTATNAIRKAQGLTPLDAVDFLKQVKNTMKDLGMPEGLLYRFVNDGFSGGEKKRNEILQMTLLQPKLAILDETDSGLDIDALKTVADGINRLRDGKRSFLLITHYQRLLDHIEPDFVHVVSKGICVKSGDKTLALELEQKGYSWLNEATA